MRFRKFWLKGEIHVEKDWNEEEVIFSVLMTVLVAAICAVFVAAAGSTVDFGD